MGMNNWITQWFIGIIYLYVLSVFFLLVVLVFLSKESAEINYLLHFPAMPKAHFLPIRPYMSSLFITLIVLRMPFQCSPCFLGDPLLKILRARSFHFPRHLFLLNPLCHYTLVFNICTELMFKGPAMADTILPEATQIRKLIPFPAVSTVQKRHGV